MFRNWCLISACLLLFAGCADDKKEAADKSTRAEVGDGTVVADETTDNAKTPSDPPPILELPAGVNPQLAAAYEQLSAGTSSRQIAGFANVSQSVGMQLAQSGNEDGYRFFKQSAALARKAISMGEPIPDNIVAGWIYNEACALAKEGNTSAAMKSLEEAVLNGFQDMDLIDSDMDIKSLRESPGFQDKLAAWKVAGLERAKENAREELAGGESFAFAFKLNDINGEEQSVDQYRGKVVIVDVWGTWCGPCVREIPSFIKLQEKYGPAGFQVLGLTYERGDEEEENQQTVQDFVERKGVNYPCILGTEAEQSQIPDFGAFPTTLFIDKSGKVRLKLVGASNYEHLDAIVAVLMEEPG